jgi:AraC-like DNA-binding protein
MYIDGREIPFSPGCLTVISPQVLHRTVPEVGCYSKWEYLFVDVEQLRRHLRRREDETELMRFLTQCGWLLEGKEAQGLLVCFDEIAQTLTQREIYHTLESEGLLLVLLSRLYRLTQRELVPSRGKPGMEDPAIGPALFYISTNYMNEIHIGDLASKCLMSESYFRKRFSQAKGMSPAEYLTWYRINVACSLLLTTDESILSIAGQTGYPSVTTFNRNFVRIAKMPPAKWRALHRK